MKSVLITGHKGTIGQILTIGLKDKYSIVGADLPEIDLIDLNNALKATTDIDVIIHLAWNICTENFVNGKYDPNNSLMFYNIYEAAYRNNVKRVIVASSIHAVDFYNNNPIDETCCPADSPYGANKRFLEELGKVYSTRGLEVICIRFGGINLLDEIDYQEYMFSKIWLSRRDCCDLVQLCIDADSIPNNFTLITAISNNKERVHDYTNLVGWLPKDDSQS